MTFISSPVGILVYMLLMSKDISFRYGSYGMSCRSCIIRMEFYLYSMHSEVGHMCRGDWLIVLLVYKGGFFPFYDWSDGGVSFM